MRHQDCRTLAARKLLNHAFRALPEQAGELEAIALDIEELAAVAKAARRKLRGRNIMGEQINARLVKRINVALVKVGA